MRKKNKQRNKNKLNTAPMKDSINPFHNGIRTGNNSPVTINVYNSPPPMQTVETSPILKKSIWHRLISFFSFVTVIGRLFTVFNSL